MFILIGWIVRTKRTKIGIRREVNSRRKFMKLTWSSRNNWTPLMLWRTNWRRNYRKKVFRSPIWKGRFRNWTIKLVDWEEKWKWLLKELRRPDSSMFLSWILRKTSSLKWRMLTAVWEIKKRPESKKVCRKSLKTSNTKTKFSERKTTSWRAEKETWDLKTPIFSNPWRIAPCWKNTWSTSDCPTTISRTSLKFSRRRSWNEWYMIFIILLFLSIVK